MCAVQIRHRLLCWPPPPGKVPPISAHSQLDFREIQASHLPAAGVFLAFQVLPGQEDADSIVMPAGAVVKVPLDVAREASCSFKVRMGDGTDVSLYAAVVSTEGKPPARGDAAHAGEAQWVLGGVRDLLRRSGCAAGDEIGFERCAPPAAAPLRGSCCPSVCVNEIGVDRCATLPSGRLFSPAPGTL